MNLKKEQLRKTVHQIPLIGIISFTMLYVYAATCYPGGSQHDLSTVGFDWIHNYWCNLMNTTAMNGETNPAKPYAITAMFILCMSLCIFFVRFAHSFSKNKYWHYTIKIAGPLSMFFATLIFTPYHDFMTTLSSFFGLFAVIGIIKELYSSPLYYYKISGIFCLVLLACNNYIYYSHQFIEILPFLQKVTFAFVLAWIFSLNVRMNQGIYAREI